MIQKFEIVRCVEESPKVMGLNIKTAVFCCIITLASLLMLTASVFSLSLNFLSIIIIKLDKKFRIKGSFEAYTNTLLKPKQVFVYDLIIKDFIKK